MLHRGDTVMQDGSQPERRSCSEMSTSAGHVDGSVEEKERLMSITSSQETKEGVTIHPISKSSADHVTQGRPSKNIGLCLDCGNPVSCPPGRGRPRSLCHSCRVKKCKECGSVFERVYRSDKKKDAGVFCSRGCFFVHRRKKINEEGQAGGEEGGGM
jgi:hypothetical protein